MAETEEPHLPTNPEEIEAPVGTFAGDEPVSPAPPKPDEGTGFDLFFPAVEHGRQRVADLAGGAGHDKVADLPRHVSCRPERL